MTVDPGTPHFLLDPNYVVSSVWMFVKIVLTAVPTAFEARTDAAAPVAHRLNEQRIP